MVGFPKSSHICIIAYSYGRTCQDTVITILVLVGITLALVIIGFGPTRECMYNKYRKLEKFHVKIIHVLNIHINLFSWVYGTHETYRYFSTNIYYHCTVDTF